MRTALIGLAALALTATVATAAPNKHGRHDGYRKQHGSSYEHVLIKRSKAQLAWVKRHAWADGRITFRERLTIRRAERQLARVIRRARYF